MWKGIYAEACNGKLQHSTFGDVERFVDSESSHFYLDGPAGYEWIFPNRIPAERESRMYVDYVGDITQRPGEKPWWSGPSVYEVKYEPSPCACVIDALANAGLTTVEGLEVVAKTWRTFEPQSQTTSTELHAQVQKMWQELEAKGLCEDGLTANHLANYHYEWPFPLWSVAQTGRERHERDQQLAEVKRERKDRVEELRKVEEIREPPPSIAEDEVRELQNAFDTYSKDRRRHEDKFAQHSESGGWRIVPAGIPDYDEDAPPYRKLKGLWEALPTEDRISLNALALFSRGHVANWHYACKHAAIVAERNDDRYQIGLGGKWLDGLRRYQAPPPLRY